VVAAVLLPLVVAVPRRPAVVLLLRRVRQLPRPLQSP
jgi:hypothetical protein